MKKYLKHFFAAILCLSVLSCAGFITEENIYRDKDDYSSTNARFIPVELFTGAKWDGKHVLKLKKVSTSTSA